MKDIESAGGFSNLTDRSVDLWRRFLAHAPFPVRRYDIIFINHPVHDGRHNKSCSHIENGMLFDKHGGQYDGYAEEK